MNFYIVIDRAGNLNPRVFKEMIDASEYAVEQAHTLPPSHAHFTLYLQQPGQDTVLVGHLWRGREKDVDLPYDRFNCWRKVT